VRTNQVMTMKVTSRSRPGVMAPSAGRSAPVSPRTERHTGVARCERGRGRLTVGCRVHRGKEM
jgi:hypothetical protein